MLVRTAHGGNCRLEFRAIAEHHCAECAFDPLPAFVAIHGVIAPRDRSNGADSELTHLLFELCDVSGATFGWRVAAVHEAMNRDVLETVPFRHFEHGKEMRKLSMHSAVAAQPHEMETVTLRLVYGV